jgi:hypothetical protein
MTTKHGSTDLERYDATQASADQNRQRLRSLGLEDPTFVTAGAPVTMPSADPARQRLLERNAQRILDRDARARAYSARLEKTVVAETQRIDARTSSPAEIEERKRKLGLDTHGLPPLRDHGPAAPVDHVKPAETAAAIDAGIEAQVRQLLQLSASGTRIDGREIKDKRVFERFVALKYASPGFPVV